MAAQAASDALFRQNFAELLRRAGALFGARVAMALRGRTVSFADLSNRAADISAALRAAGVKPGDRCGVLVREPDDAAAAFFAALAVGAVGININELYRPRQVEYVLAHSGATALVVSDDILQTHPRPIASDARMINLDAVTRVGAPLEVVDRRPDDAAQVTYTSGSTGQPKGVVMGHANLWAGVRIVAGYLGLTGDDRIASLLPFSFVYGFNQLTTSLFSGATLVVERSTLPQEIVATLAREKVSVLAAVPPLWQRLLEAPAFRDERLETLRIVTNAGGRLPPATVVQLRRAQPQARLFLMYGLTEVFRSTFLPPDEVDAHPDSMGRAIPESVVYVVGDDDRQVPTGEVGQLVHGGPTVGIGYLGDDEATARVFRPNPFLGAGEAGPPRVVFSGDLVRRDEDGRLYYVARSDRMIKTLGFRVSPDEIGDVIQASGQVSEAAVITEPDAQRTERIVACVVLRQDGSLDALRKFCAMELPRYMQPARYVVVAAIPRNASGKHDLFALKREISGEPPARDS